jgi:uncharacterized protein with HEPN domain
MSNRAVDVLLDDILTSINYIAQFIADCDIQSFRDDRKTLDATIRNLEVIGEAAKLLPDEFKQQHPHIAWKQLIGLRNVVIHAYFRVDAEILWQIVTQDLPRLKPNIESMLNQFDETGTDDSATIETPE